MRFKIVCGFYICLFSCALFAGKKADSLEALLPKVSGKERLKVLSALTDVYSRNDRQKAWAYFDEYEKLYFLMKEPRELRGDYYHKKGTRLSHEGDYDGAILNYQKAEPFFIEGKDFVQLWNLYNGFGAAYTESSNKEKSLFYFVKAFKIAEEKLGENFLAGSSLNLGAIYAEAGDFKEALKYFNLAKNYYEKSGDGWGYGNSLNNVGQVYALIGKKDSAFYYYTKALGVWERIADENGLAMTHFNLGDLSLQNKDYTDAEMHLQRSLEISEHINEEYGITQNLGSLSTLYFESGNKIKGLEYLEKSIEHAKKNHILKSINENYRRMYNFYKTEGDYKHALFAHEEFFYWYDSLNNSEKNKNLQELYSKFETTKKQKEIEKQKAEISEKNLEIARQRNYEIMLAAGLGVALLLAGIIFTSLRLNKKKNKIISEQNEEVIHQKKMLEEKNNEVHESIVYAKRIQTALLASEKLLQQQLKDYFVFFKPKDIVSGDFYWASLVSGLKVAGSGMGALPETTNMDPGTKQFYLAVCDSTGHGVPGAFMSLLNISFLNQAINEKNIREPGKVFDYVRSMLIQSLSGDDENEEGGQDGMDGTLLCFDFENKTLSYVSANNHLWMIRDQKFMELHIDKMPVGKSHYDKTAFSTHTTAFNEGDQFYALTDGYADQFGGAGGRKYKYKSLKEVILFNSAEKMEVQKQRLIENFNNWKGDTMQIDDVLIAGVLM